MADNNHEAGLRFRGHSHQYSEMMINCPSHSSVFSIFLSKLFLLLSTGNCLDIFFPIRTTIPIFWACTYSFIIWGGSFKINWVQVIASTSFRTTILFYYFIPKFSLIALRESASSWMMMKHLNVMRLGVHEILNGFYPTLKKICSRLHSSMI